MENGWIETEIEAPSTSFSISPQGGCTTHRSYRAESALLSWLTALTCAEERLTLFVPRYLFASRSPPESTPYQIGRLSSRGAYRTPGDQEQAQLAVRSHQHNWVDHTVRTSARKLRTSIEIHQATRQLVDRPNNLWIDQTICGSTRQFVDRPDNLWIAVVL